MKISKRVRLIIRKPNRRFFSKKKVSNTNKQFQKFINYFNFCHLKYV